MSKFKQIPPKQKPYKIAFNQNQIIRFNQIQSINPHLSLYPADFPFFCPSSCSCSFPLFLLPLSFIHTKNTKQKSSKAHIMRYYCPIICINYNCTITYNTIVPLYRVQSYDYTTIYLQIVSTDCIYRLYQSIIYIMRALPVV